MPTTPSTSASRTGDRRPLATRDTAFAQRAANWLIARGASANAISGAGMVFGLAAGGALAATALWPDARRALWFAGAALVQLRLLCNMLDGMVAVGSGTASATGELWNEVPDRVSDTATLVGLGYAFGGEPWLGWLAAVLAMATAYVRAVGKGAGTTSDFRGPMAKPQRMFTVTVTALYLTAAPPSWQPQLGDLAMPALALAVIASGSLVTAVRRLTGIAAQLREGGR